MCWKKLRIHFKGSNVNSNAMCIKVVKRSSKYKYYFKKFQRFQISHLFSSLVWKFQISNSHDMFEKFQVSNISNSTSCFKSHLKVSNKQPLWWVSKVSSFKKFQIAHLITSLIWKFQISNPPWWVSKVSSFKKFQIAHLIQFSFESFK